MDNVLTPEEFAHRLKIGRSTLFDWLAKGILLPGRHYFRVGRILRFIWSDEVIADLLSISATGVKTELKAAPVRQYGGGGNARGKTQKINWEY